LLGGFEIVFAYPLRVVVGASGGSGRSYTSTGTVGFSRLRWRRWRFASSLASTSRMKSLMQLISHSPPTPLLRRGRSVHSMMTRPRYGSLTILS
jgi:hypothetical protein